MADRILKFGGTITVDTNARICRMLNIGEGASESKSGRGSLYLAGANRVYIGWAEKDVTTDTSEEDNKCWLDAAGPIAIRIPADVSSFVVKTAANTSALMYIAD